MRESIEDWRSPKIIITYLQHRSILLSTLNTQHSNNQPENEMKKKINEKTQISQFFGHNKPIDKDIITRHQPVILFLHMNNTYFSHRKFTKKK